MLLHIEFLQDVFEWKINLQRKTAQLSSLYRRHGSFIVTEVDTK